MSTDNKYLDAVYKYYECIFSPATAKKENKITRARTCWQPSQKFVHLPYKIQVQTASSTGVGRGWWLSQVPHPSRTFGIKENQN